MTKYERFVCGLLISIYEMQTLILLEVCRASERERYVKRIDEVSGRINAAVDIALEDEEHEA